ncbi:SR-related and CTD-associated factor 4b [Pseudorasbora parva]|uniref:SR-related and CTD-associated factor 4b n=1 Tax=Pseudorasbora parva TaxID=51549 RepID=UPI00351DE3FC
MDMDAVNAFNGEMSSMMDMTPPISRAKMMSVTKAGIKAIKLYKHVVQIVEKFIKRCKPDLKVAGLYVVDSIIRQSRHQFGADKDLFGPRFLKNFTVTFQNLFQCPAEDKVKILRVLNLWQKNDVFGMDVIQPLSDMATAPVLPVLENGTAVAAAPAAMLLPVPESVPVPEPAPAPAPAVVTATATPVPTVQNPVSLTAVAQLLQGTGGIELQHLLQTLQQAGGAGSTQSTAPPLEQKPSLAKSLLDRFDYDDDPEPVEEKAEPAPAAPITINLPPELQQALQAHLLSQIVNQTQMQGQVVSQGQVPSQGEVAPQEFPSMVQTKIPENLPQTFEESIIQPSTAQQQQDSVETERSIPDGRDRRHSRRTKSRSPRKQSSTHSRRSRSGSRSQRDRSKYHRTRSRSRERRGRSPRARSEEKRDREKERERRQKGLPPIKKETLSVCTTTLWVGQLDKKTQQQDIMSLMEEFGQIESINMIPPRGCAYIVMVHRQDAYTALNKLSRGAVKVNQKSIKIAWALNKGIKTDLKKYWDVERGVTYVPWEKVKPDDILSLQDGGMLDSETLKSEWRSAVAKLAVPVTEGPEGKQEDGAALPAVSQSPSGQPVATMNVIPGPLPNMSLPPPAMITGASPPSFIPIGFNPPQMPAGFPRVLPVSSMNPAGPRPSITESPTREPSEDTPEVPKSHMDPAGAQALSSPPHTGILGPRPGPLGPHPPVGMRPPFMPAFPNNGPHPIHPPQNMPPQMMPPRGPNPMFGEPPVGRFRMTMMGAPRQNFPPHRLPMGPRGEEPHWRDQAPERGPDRFGSEPPFQRGGWGRGGLRGRSRFGN